MVPRAPSNTLGTHWGFAGCIELNHLLGSVYLPHCCSHCVRPQATLCNGPPKSRTFSGSWLPATLRTRGQTLSPSLHICVFCFFFFISPAGASVCSLLPSKKKGFERKDKYLVVVFVFLSSLRRDAKAMKVNISEHCNWNAAKAATWPFQRLFSHFFSRWFGHFVLFLCLLDRGPR